MTIFLLAPVGDLQTMATTPRGRIGVSGEPLHEVLGVATMPTTQTHIGTTYTGTNRKISLIKPPLI